MSSTVSPRGAALRAAISAGSLNGLPAGALLDLAYLVHRAARYEVAFGMHGKPATIRRKQERELELLRISRALLELGQRKAGAEAMLPERHAARDSSGPCRVEDTGAGFVTGTTSILGGLAP